MTARNFVLQHIPSRVQDTNNFIVAQVAVIDSNIVERKQEWVSCGSEMLEIIEADAIATKPPAIRAYNIEKTKVSWWNLQAVCRLLNFKLGR